MKIGYKLKKNLIQSQVEAEKDGFKLSSLFTL